MIINSILDTDLYKFTIQQFILQQYPSAVVEYIFNNRDKTMSFNQKAFDALKEEIENLTKLCATSDELEYLKNRNIFSDEYLDYLESYRFNTSQLNVSLDANNQLNIKITGKWVETVLWEVPLMAIISEIYFKYCDSDWIFDPALQIQMIKEKGEKLTINGCIFSDFGTRRRRSKFTHQLVVENLIKFPAFMGTSNPYFAKMFNVPVVGTMAHEVVCAISALESMNHPNKFAMEKWEEVYRDKLSIFLPDTYGIKSFFKDFDFSKAFHWNGVRHDSGCPFEFTDAVIAHYNSLNLTPENKTIIFSDSLNVDKAIELKKFCFGRIKCSFGIGTNFTNDYKKFTNCSEKSKPMNMVIKLVKCNDVNVCKLSQNPEKAMGDKDAIRIMNHLHFGKELFES